MRILAIVAGLSALLAPSAGFAECRLPEEVLASPRGAAEWLLENTDDIGFARVIQRQDPQGLNPERLELLFPLKGSSRTITMLLPVENGIWFLTNSATSFGVDPGTIVFAALTDTPGGAVISECTMYVLYEAGQDNIIAALSEIVRERDFAG